MNKYEQLRAIRNKHYPPKLEFGCQIYKGRLATVSEFDGEVIICVFKGAEVPTGVFSLKEFEQESGLIYGKEVTLSEILLMSKENIFITRNGEIRKYINVKNTGGLLEHTYLFNLDLTIPISQQSDEVLENIIKLVE